MSYEAIVLYESEQNEVTEWSNELLIKKVRIMILNSEASYTLWSETVKTACYLLNWLSSLTLKNDKVFL